MKLKKRSKGFVFAISAIYIMATFMFFLSIYNSQDIYPNYLDSYKLQDYNNFINFLDDQPNPNFTNRGWCDFYYKYDSNSDLNKQSNLQIKKYCDEYAR